MLVSVNGNVLEMSVIKTRGPGAKFGAQMRVGGHLRKFLNISGNTEEEAQMQLEYQVSLLEKGRKKIVTRCNGRPAFANAR